MLARSVEACMLLRKRTDARSRLRPPSPPPTMQTPAHVAHISVHENFPARGSDARILDSPSRRKFLCAPAPAATATPCCSAVLRLDLRASISFSCFVPSASCIVQAAAWFARQHKNGYIYLWRVSSCAIVSCIGVCSVSSCLLPPYRILIDYFHTVILTTQPKVTFICLSRT